MSDVSWKCSVHSSTLTTRIFAVRFGADDVMRELQRVHGRRAAHEADRGPLDGRMEPQPVDELLVDAGRR